MKIHELKIQEKYWKQIFYGNKTFELRKDDRNYQEGDLINFHVIIGDKPRPTGAVFKITYILRNVPEYGLSNDYCILGIRQLKEV